MFVVIAVTSAAILFFAKSAVKQQSAWSLTTTVVSASVSHQAHPYQWRPSGYLKRRPAPRAILP